MPAADCHDGLVLTRSRHVDTDLQRQSMVIRSRAILSSFEPGQRKQSVLGLRGKLTAHAGLPERGSFAPRRELLINPAWPDKIRSWQRLKHRRRFGEAGAQGAQTVQGESCKVRRVEGVNREGPPEFPLAGKGFIKSPADVDGIAQCEQMNAAAGAGAFDALPDVSFDPGGFVNHKQ